MKRSILALCIVLAVFLTACGKQTPEKKKTEKQPEPISEIYADEESNADNRAQDETADDGQENDSDSTAAGRYAPASVSGAESVYDSIIADSIDDDATASASVVEKGTMPSTLSTPWDKYTFCNFTGGAEAKADELRQKVLNSVNTAELYKWTGKTYYLSPDGNDENDGLSPKTAVKTLNADCFYTSPLQPGDAVLFERGGVWRMTTSISTREGVTYGSYGTGEKPTLVGSAHNYAEAKYWTPSSKANIWKVVVADTDIGEIVFNHGELVGTKKFNGITALENEGDYYFNSNEDMVYLYSTKGNPGKYYKDIEICLRKNAFGCSRDNVTIDNFRIKYYGTFGVAMCGNNHTTITNCEIGFIGGAVQSGTLRFGNGIQQWNSVDELTIKNCWVYQCYDTGITFQGNETYETGYDAEGNKRVGDKVYYKDISFVGNLLEHNVLNYEIWHGDDTTLARVLDFHMTDNICRYAGYVWSIKQRPDFVGYNIYSGKTDFANAERCLIQNNIFDTSIRSIVYWSFSSPQSGFTISGNTFYQHSNTRNEAMWFGTTLYPASSQATLETAVATFDSNPKLVKWLD